MTLTIALWLFVALFVAVSVYFGRRSPSLETQILSVSKILGPEAAAQRFSVPLKTVHRLRVIHALEAKSCATCEHFDLPKGQAAIAADANMIKITRALSPAKISKDESNNQSWLDFGACLKQPGTITGSTDWCGNPKHKTEDMWA